jgi:FixJ family two-component response regulator
MDVLWSKPAKRPPVTLLTQGCVVYIVDDDDLVRTGLARLMRAGGFKTKSYETPERFLKEVVAESPACILLDITMPRITGLQVQERLKEMGIDMPVIAVSARDDDETRQRARDLDARFFLRKPVDDQALLDAIAWVTETGNARQPGTSGAARQNGPPGPFDSPAQPESTSEKTK